MQTLSPRWLLPLALAGAALTSAGCLSSTQTRLGVDARRAESLETADQARRRLPEVVVIGVYYRDPTWLTRDVEMLQARQLPGDGVGVLEYPGRLYYQPWWSGQGEQYRPRCGAVAMARDCWPVVVDPNDQGLSHIEWYDQSEPGRLDGVLRLTFLPMIGPGRAENPADADAIYRLLEHQLDPLIASIRNADLSTQRRSELLMQLLQTTQNLDEATDDPQRTVLLDRAQQRIGEAMAQ